MIVRELADGRLLCMRQTSHALMAAAFCRHWGNADFAPPTPYDAVLLAVGQHDNGWYEWEKEPDIRPDGYPMDFIHGPNGREKIDLWTRGITRVGAQHPYAGLLVRRHATLLYAGYIDRLSDPDERRMNWAFIDAWPGALADARRLLDGAPGYVEALRDEAIEANTRLLQFGDTASLQPCVPWPAERRFPHCPVDQNGNFTEIVMRYDEATIAFDPWPFGIDAFSVSIHGRVLRGRHYVDHAAYRAALAEAPLLTLSWRVVPG